MSPFKVNRIIKDSSEKMCIDTLSKQCGVHLRHSFLKMSKDFFDCPVCGMKRHYVRGVSFYGWTHLAFYEDRSFDL